MHAKDGITFGASSRVGKVAARKEEQDDLDKTIREAAERLRGTYTYI